VGSTNRLKAVRWGIATNIVGAWVLTIPMSAIIAWLTFWAMGLAGGAK
jgi:PiT family inorganic phosphate transporter